MQRKTQRLRTRGKGALPALPALEEKKRSALLRVLAGGLTVLIAFSVVGAVLNMFQSTLAAENEYLFNIPYTYIPPRTPADLNWNKFLEHSDGKYDRAYTETISQAFNGTATTDRLVINDESITFFGYDVKPYVDYCFTDAYPTLTGINITMRPMQMIFHTFYQTGFLFNGIMEEVKVSNKVTKTYYTGYAVVLECSNSEGMLESGTATLKLVYIDHEEWDVNAENSSRKADQGKSPLTTRTLLATLKAGIQNRTTPLFRITLEIDPATRAFQLYIDGELRARIAKEEVKGGSDCVGIGFFTEYYYHNCDILTVVRYDDLNLEFAAIEPPMSTSTLRFMLDTGSTVLRSPETEKGYTALQYYRVEQPAVLEVNGETYYLVDSNMVTLGYPLDRDIVRRYESTAVNANANTVILYYSKDPPNQLGNKPRKFGSVNGGDWKTGSPQLPVPVDGNYDLEYNVVSGPKPMTQEEHDNLPVLTLGNSSAATNTTWMKQPQTAAPTPNIAKNTVATINTVSLTENYPTLADFNDEVTEWRGENIVKAWDATYSPNDNVQFVTQYHQQNSIPAGTYDNNSIITHLNSLDVPGMNISGAVTSNPYSGSSSSYYDNLVLYRISLKNGQAPEQIRWNGYRDSSNNIVLLYTGGNWEQIGTVTATSATWHTWTLTSPQKAGISGEYAYVAFFSIKTGSYAGIYNGNALEPFELVYASSGAEAPERCYIWLTERPESTSVSRRYNMYIGGKGGVQLAQNAAYQFANFSVLSAINFSRLHTDNTLSMAYMFSSCTALTKLDVSWFYTLNVQNMSGMFYGCSGLTSVDVKYFNTKNVTNMNAMFQSCSRLTSLALRGWDTAKVKDMASMFYGCSGLTGLDLLAFDTGLVQNMNSMFRGCTGLKTLNISTFNTANVANMGYMFYNCYGLTSANLVVKNFNTANVTEIAYMFYGCSGLTTPLDCSSFDTSNPGLTSMESMFQGCSYLQGINVSSFKTHNILVFTNMFSGCTRLQTLDVTNFDTSSGENMYGMFYSCSTLTSLNVTKFNTANVINMNNMFAGCSGLTSLDLSHFNTSACKTMFGMFQSCSSLNALDLSSFNTSNVTGTSTSAYTSTTANFGGMAYMFYGCSRLSTLNLSSFNTANVGTMAYMFYQVFYSGSATGLVLDLRHFNTSNVKNMSYMFGYNPRAEFKPGALLLDSWDTSGVTDMSYMFYYCAGFTGNDFDAFLAHFNTSSVTTMSSMFASCSGITKISLLGFNTANVTGMTSMFASCTKLTEVDLRSFDTSKVSSFASMFSGCSALTTAGVYDKGIQYFNTSSSGSFASMFSGCTTLTSLDLRNFSTGGASSFASMFQGCTNLASVDLSSFSTVNATTMASMFSGCSTLTVLDLRNFNVERVTTFSGMFQGCTKLATLHLSSFCTKAATTFASMFMDCPALTSLDLSTFVTDKATSFSDMFSGCTGLTSLDLGNFDTKSATTFYHMFYNCTGLASLTGISHFDTANVTDMRGMFYGCCALTSLDIRWWKGTSLIYMQDMFNTVTGSATNGNLATIHMESLVLEKINAKNPSSSASITRMIANIKSEGMTVYVGITDMLTWFNDAQTAGTISPDMARVSRVLTEPWPNGTNPGPDEPAAAVVLNSVPVPPAAHLTPAPATPATPVTPTTPTSPAAIPITTPTPPVVQPPVPNPPKTVTDSIPAGLQIMTVSGGGVRSGQDLSWVVDSFTFDLYIMTKVTPRVDDDGFMYENFATVHIGGDENTTTTYHVYGLYWLVSEQYYYLGSDGTKTRIASNNAFNDGNPVMVRNGKNFNINPLRVPNEIYGLYYYGYQYITEPTDDPAASGKGDIHVGPPPDPAYTNVQGDKMIRYYYRSFPVAVYVHFVDAAGNELQETVVWPANQGSNYYMPVRYLDPIQVGPVLYNYYGYKLTAPGVGAHKTRGSEPDYTILKNDGSPQFFNIQQDQHITLYFDPTPTVTVYFLDDHKPSNVIRGSQTYFVTSGSFTPAPSLFNDITSAGNLYEYADNWSFDDGARRTVPDKPGTFSVTTNVDLNLFFKTHYNIVEKFHTDLEPRYDGAHNRLPPVELSPDVFRDRLPAGTAYTGAPPTVIVDGEGFVWSYVGYKLFDDANMTYLGIPSVAGLEEHLTIIFVYEKSATAPAIQKLSSVPSEEALLPGEEFTYTISVEYPTAKSGTMVFEDLLPAGLQYVSSIPAASTSTVSGRTKVTASVPLASNKAQLKITVRVMAEEATFYNYADVTDPSSKVYRTNTVVNHSGGTLDSVTIQKSANPPSGTQDNPKMVAKGSEIEYTLTVNNANEGRRIPAVITDVLAPGFVFLESAGGDGGSYNNGSRTITWNVTALPDGNSTYTFTARADNAAVVYENTASIVLPGLGALQSNATWHAVAAPVPALLDIAVKNAYINEDVAPANGSQLNPVAVMLGDTLKYTIGFEKPAVLTVANPVFQQPAAPPAKINFVNGGFEVPNVHDTAANGGHPSATETVGPGMDYWYSNAAGISQKFNTPHQNVVPGWKTIPVDPLQDGLQQAPYFDFILNNYPNTNFHPIEGSQWAELNAFIPGTLYQDCVTVPGTKVFFEFSHRGRVSTDTMDFYLYGVPDANSMRLPGRNAFALTQGEFFKSYVTGISDWVKYTGVYTIPAGQTMTRFAFQSRSGAPSAGNFLDGIRLYTNSFIELTKSNNAPSVSGTQTADAGSKVTYTVKMQNTGESDADNVVLRDLLPAGTSLVANSVKIDGTATSNYTYNPDTRLVKVNVGAGATNALGGMLAGAGSFSTDCNNVYTVTFDVLVDGRVVAQNLKFENQAKVNYTDRYDTQAYQYTNYSNVSTFALGKGLRDIVIDKVPQGLAVDVPSVTAGGGVYNAVTHTVTWDVTARSAGTILLSFEATVDMMPEDEIYMNKAWVGAQETNATWHKMVIPKPIKNAYINGSSTAANGTQSAPEPVKVGDKITYKIDVFNPGILAGAHNIAYDFIFVLDWSGSMTGGMMTSGKTGANINARLYSKDLILDMSQELFSLYPGSRISVMGVNSSLNCYDAANRMFLQVDTPFVGIGDYVSTIEHAYDYAPGFSQDDNSQFLAAAVDKMAGIDTVAYGGLVGSATTGNTQNPARLPQNGPYYVNARSAGDMGRVPVIVHISDFQMTEAAGGTNNSGRNYWTGCMKDQSDRFFQLCPDGVLMTVRVAHSGNSTYSSAQYTTLMETNVAPAGHSLWSFTNVPSTKPYLEAFQELKDKILASAPPTALGGTVTDVVPEGLELDVSSINPAGTYDSLTRTITWDLSAMELGWNTLSFDVTVKKPGVYENTAKVVYDNGEEDESNTTYHFLDLFTLHIRQIIVDPLNDLQQPVMGYYTLKNGGETLHLTSDSATAGYPFTDYTLIPGDDLIYVLTDLIPQYYEFAGHMQNEGDKELPDPGGHPKASPLTGADTTTLNGKIKLDYTDTGEIWITVYITPAGTPGKNQTGVKTNDFGTVHRLNPPAVS